MKRAFIVVGPESSGTRMLTEIFVRSGCDGVSDHVQEFDTNPPLEQKNIVWRRSVPHGGVKNPDIDYMFDYLKNKNYNVTFIVINRDIFCTVKSQVKNEHTKTESESIKNIQDSFLFIFDFIKKSNIEYFLINYESLVYQKINTLQNLSNLINFKLIDFDVKNENLKWIK